MDTAYGQQGAGPEYVWASQFLQVYVKAMSHFLSLYKMLSILGYVLVIGMLVDVLV